MIWGLVAIGLAARAIVAGVTGNGAPASLVVCAMAILAPDGAACCHLGSVIATQDPVSGMPTRSIMAGEAGHAAGAAGVVIAMTTGALVGFINSNFGTVLVCRTPAIGMLAAASGDGFFRRKAVEFSSFAEIKSFLKADIEG